MPKNLVLLLATTILSYFSFAQEIKPDDAFYAYDADWKGTTLDKATYFSRMRKIDDTTYRWDNYNMSGPMIKIETFKDKDGSIAHGYFSFFQPNGYIDSTGHFYNDLAQGNWYFYNDTGRLVKQKYYEKGVLIKTRDILKEDEEQKKLENTDSAREAQKKEIESDFVGKLNAWRKFLEHNLNYPDRAVKSNIQGDVIIRFVIDTEGNVTDPEIFRSVEWSLDEEALRIIKKAKRWTPAVQKGKVVKSYKMQPIYFRLQ